MMLAENWTCCYEVSAECMQRWQLCGLGAHWAGCGMYREARKHMDVVVMLMGGTVAENWTWCYQVPAACMRCWQLCWLGAQQELRDTPLPTGMHGQCTGRNALHMKLRSAMTRRILIRLTVGMVALLPVVLLTKCLHWTTLTSTASDSTSHNPAAPASPVPQTNRQLKRGNTSPHQRNHRLRRRGQGNNMPPLSRHTKQHRKDTQPPKTPRNIPKTPFRPYRLRRLVWIARAKHLGGYHLMGIRPHHRAAVIHKIMHDIETGQKVNPQRRSVYGQLKDHAEERWATHIIQGLDPWQPTSKPTRKRRRGQRKKKKKHRAHSDTSPDNDGGASDQAPATPPKPMLHHNTPHTDGTDIPTQHNPTQPPPLCSPSAARAEGEMGPQGGRQACGSTQGK